MQYVMSDIHGQYDKYLSMMDKIQFSDNDHLYIIGDVIDRGPDGGKMLLEALTNKNITLLMGNHELMMAEAGDGIEEANRWLSNGAENTIDQLAEMDFQIEDFLDMLVKLPVSIPDLVVNGKKYCLVHAYPPENHDNKIQIYESMNQWDAFQAVWSRIFRDPFSDTCQIFEQYPDTTFIIGHTPIHKCSYAQYDESGSPIISSCCNGRVINIDCGCAAGLRLGCMRLDDGMTFYT